ncbi:MAG: TIR domain-containing protein [Candidatus Schekmanbacteria bacterium]|nr:TIR domain-containing protein [Candidatus Schekmanbacteria bacterium]
MRTKIFISYSHSDKLFVDWLTRKLNESNINTWYDSNEIKLGDSIKQRIKEGLEASSSIIVVFSKNSSKSEWVRHEFNSALLHNSITKGIRIIILKIDDVVIPTDIAGYLYIDLSKDREKGLEYLIKEIKLAPVATYSKLDWKKLNYKDFENLIYELLTKEGFAISRTPKTRDGGFDFVATIPNKFESNDKILIETKFYNNQKISIDILRQLYSLSLSEKADKVFLVTNSELTNSSRDFLSHSATNIVVWEEQKLLNKLYTSPDILEKYFSIKPLKEPRQVKLIDKEFSNIQQLIQELDNCSEGEKGWKQYEDICVKILTQLFVPPLGTPKLQSRRQSGIDIRDAIFPNRSKEENWRFIREDYDAKYIVVEFNNYSEKGSDIDKQTILQISDYLKKTIGRFGIICSRKLPNNSGIEKRKDTFIEQNKLVLFVSNDHLKEMLRRKYKKLDPSDVIIDLIDDFNLSF